MLYSFAVTWNRFLMLEELVGVCAKRIVGVFPLSCLAEENVLNLTSTNLILSPLLPFSGLCYRLTAFPRHHLLRNRKIKNGHILLKYEMFRLDNLSI